MLLKQTIDLHFFFYDKIQLISTIVGRFVDLWGEKSQRNLNDMQIMLFTKKNSVI